jgi:PadR family transcriptional regulator, regulatory protein PadR
MWPYNMNANHKRAELMQGSLEMLILNTLKFGEQHGFRILRIIHAASGGVLELKTGSLYPALQRLERQGWVSAVWKKCESNQQAKFYRITQSGEERLAAAYDDWRRMVGTVEQIMNSSFD